ncbi:hypothetical protein GCM10027299_56080 [Larkinella ripae]
MVKPLTWRKRRFCVNYPYVNAQVAVDHTLGPRILQAEKARLAKSKQLDAQAKHNKLLGI